MPQHIFEQLETYKDLFDSAHDLIYLLEPDGKIIYVNNAWKKNLGYSEDEIYGKSIYSIVAPSDLDRFKTYRESVLKGANPEKEIIIGLVRRSGAIMNVEGFVTAKVIEGSPVYTRGIFHDITRRIENEAQLSELHEQLKESEASLQQLFFYAPDAIIVINAQSIIRYWNPKAAQVFGWSYAEVLDKSLSQIIIPPQYREAHEAGMKRFLTTGEERVLNKTIEITSLHKDGREFYVALTISSMTVKSDVSFIAFVRDIDEQKRNARDLEQKKEQLEASNLQLEQFAHVASHDMKEPIRKILMYGDRLKTEIGEKCSEAGKTYLRKIESAANRLANMVEGVLLNSTLQAEQLIPERVDLNTVIKDIETDLELIIEKKKASIKYSALPTLEGSPFLLYQLFYNLIINSLKFSRPDVPAVIELRAVRATLTGRNARRFNPDSAYFEILVEDNGIGFDQADAETIFKTFSRLHSNKEFEGTGIGLSLCKNIVEKHGGFIQAIGQKNKGATFKIYLPEVQKV